MQTCAGMSIASSFRWWRHRITSMNGKSTWNPAPSTPWNFPSRSTTYALCCGTTTAVFTTTKIAKTARTIAMTRAALMVSMSSPEGRALLGADPEREAVEALDAAPLAGAERDAGHGARAPRHPAELGLPLAAGRDLAEEHDLLADDRVHGDLRPLQLLLQRPAQRGEQHDRDHGEQDPLRDRARAERRDHGGRERADPEEQGEEPARRHHLDDEQPDP